MPASILLDSLLPSHKIDFHEMKNTAVKGFGYKGFQIYEYLRTFCNRYDFYMFHIGMVPLYII